MTIKLRTASLCFRLIVVVSILVSSSVGQAIAQSNGRSNSWTNSAAKNLGYCIRPNIQYGKFSSLDGGKSAVALISKCPAEASEFRRVCEASGDMGADYKSKCSLMLGVAVQFMLKEMGR